MSLKTNTTSTLPLICICGPTGAGKTAVSLYLAQMLPAILRQSLHGAQADCAGCEIINADSRQLYADFPIITAQPSPEEQAQTPHSLFGFLPSGERMSAGVYSHLAAHRISECLQNAWQDNGRAKGRSSGRDNDRTDERSGRAPGEGWRIPILVGGTGLYIKSLLEGIAQIPAIPVEIAGYWRERCRNEGPAELHKILQLNDPALAARLHPNDKQRIIRGLEVYSATGKSLSLWHAQAVPPPPYRVLKLGIGQDIKDLESRLALRIDKMLEQGAIEEAIAARINCNDPISPGWSGIGCAELWRYLADELSLDECKKLWLSNTRAYAKRQITWFKSDPDINWFSTEEADKALQRAIAFFMQ